MSKSVEEERKGAMILEANLCCCVARKLQRVSRQVVKVPFNPRVANQLKTQQHRLAQQREDTMKDKALQAIGDYVSINCPTAEIPAKEQNNIAEIMVAMAKAADNRIEQLDGVNASQLYIAVCCLRYMMESTEVEE